LSLASACASDTPSWRQDRTFSAGRPAGR
jgi:hypothetical protein